jgi:hypothetical protein
MISESVDSTKTYICLTFTTNNTSFAVITSPAFLLEMLNQIRAVDPTRRVNRVATAIAGDQGLLITNRVALVGSKAFHAYWQWSWPLKS